MTSTQFINTTTTDVLQDVQEQGGNGVSVFNIVVFTIFAIAGIAGNSLVLVVFFKVRELHVITNILIGHQSLVDLISSIFLLPNYFIPRIDLGLLSLHHNGLANLICKILIDEYLYWTLLKVSTMNLVFITIERYLAVVHPIKYRKASSKRVAISVCVSAWILGGIINLYFPLTHEVSDTGECNNDKLERGSSGRYVIAVITLLTTLVLPLLIMLYVYIAIIWKLRLTKSDKPSTATALESVDVRSQQRPPDTKTAGFRERGRKNVLITLFIVSVTYAICWTPDMVLYFHHNVVTRHDWSDPLHQFVILLAVSNVFVNPIIYTLKYKSFQKGLKKLFKMSPDASRQISSAVPASTTDSKF